MLCSLDKYSARLTKAITKINNIFVKNIVQDDLTDMPKFDYIIQNPPYNGNLHLEFFKKGLELLSEDGKMTIIEPATWLINFNDNNKNTNIIKNRIQNHVFKIIIDNFAKIFNVGLYVPCSISFIDMSKIYDNINFICCGYKKKITTINDSNLIGDYNLIYSIINKIKNDNKNDKLIKHVYNPKENNTLILNNKNNWFTKFCFSQIGGGSIIESGGHTQGGQIKYEQDSLYIKIKNGEYRKSYIHVMYHTIKNSISNKPIKSLDSGKKFTNNDATCLYDSKKHLENWVFNIFNIKLLLFISICYTINASNNIKYIMPWLVDKKYSDNEIYKIFDLTEEEIKLIETIIKKYERNSPWFKRYMCGPSSVSDEEVQKFIDNLEND